MNRAQIFYAVLAAVDLDATFTKATSSFKLKAQCKHIKIACVANNVEFSLNGKDVDGVIKPTDGLVQFDGLESARIHLRHTGVAPTEVRVWAW